MLSVRKYTFRFIHVGYSVRMFSFVIFQHSDNPLYSARVKDAHQSEERRFLRRGVQLAAEKET